MDCSIYLLSIHYNDWLLGCDLFKMLIRRTGSLNSSKHQKLLHCSVLLSGTMRTPCPALPRGLPPLGRRTHRGSTGERSICSIHTTISGSPLTPRKGKASELGTCHPAMYCSTRFEWKGPYLITWLVQSLKPAKGHLGTFNRSL